MLRKENYKLLLLGAVLCISHQTVAMEAPRHTVDSAVMDRPKLDGPGCWLTTHLYSRNQHNTYPIATRTLQSTALQPLLDRGQYMFPVPTIPSHLLPDVIKALGIKHKLKSINDKQTHQDLLTQLHRITDTRQKLHTILMAANYLEHEALLAWCQNKWTQKRYSTTENTQMPMELETPIAASMLKNAGFSKGLPELIARTFWINHQKTFLDVHSSSLWTTALNHDSSRIATGGLNGQITIYSPESDHPLLSFEAHQAPIATIAYSADGSQISTCARDGSIKFWNSSTGEFLHQIGTQAHTPFVFRHSPNQKAIAHSQNTEIRLIRPETGEQFFLTGHTNSIEDIAFNHTSSLLASCGYDKKVKLWDLATNECIKTFSRHSKTVLCVQFSPDGTLLAAGGDDKKITVYNVKSHKLVATLRGHRGGVWHVCFSPDNQLLFSGSIDGTIKIWNIATKRFIKNLNRRQSAIQSMSMNADGFLATVSRSGYLNLWDMSPLTSLIQDHQQFINRSTGINQAALITQAFNAPQHRPLDCSKRERSQIYKTLPLQLQKILEQQLNVKPPEKKRKTVKAKKQTTKNKAPSTENKRSRRRHRHS